MNYFDKFLFRIAFTGMFGAGTLILTLFSIDRKIPLAQVLEKNWVQISLVGHLTSHVTNSSSLFPHL